MFLLSSFYFLIICLSHFDIVDFPHAWSSWLSIHVYEWIFRKLIESSVYIYRTFQLVDFMVGSLGWQGFSIGNLQMSESVVYEFGSWSVFFWRNFLQSWCSHCSVYRLSLNFSVFICLPHVHSLFYLLSLHPRILLRDGGGVVRFSSTQPSELLELLAFLYSGDIFICFLSYRYLLLQALPSLWQVIYFSVVSYHFII